MTVKWQSHPYLPLRDSTYPLWIPSTLDTVYFLQDTTVNWVDLNAVTRATIFSLTTPDTSRCIYAPELQAAFPGFTVYGWNYTAGQGFSLRAFAGNNPLMRC